MSKVEWIIYTIIGLPALYILFRIVSRAIFKSYFEVKTEHTTKEVKKDASKI